MFFIIKQNIYEVSISGDKIAYISSISGRMMKRYLPLTVIIFLYQQLIFANGGFILEDTIYITDYLPPITIQNTSQNILTIDSIRLLNREDIVPPFDTMTLSFRDMEFSCFTYDPFGNRDSNNNRISILPGNSMALSVTPSILSGINQLICAFFAVELLDTLNILIIPMEIAKSSYQQNYCFKENAVSLYLKFDAAGRRLQGYSHASGLRLFPGSSNPRQIILSRWRAK